MLRIFALLLCLIAGTTSAAGNISSTILVFGDSLSAGYGIAVAQSWPSLLAQQIEEQRLPYTVINASISGETTAGGRSRLPVALKLHRPQIVILALGANDGLRGLPLDAMHANLQAMVRASRTAGARVLLAGMQLPPNYGPDFTRNFNGMFASVAKQERIALLPFLLEPVALDDAAFQPDRLHPTAAAQPQIRDHVWQALKPLLTQR